LFEVAVFVVHGGGGGGVEADGFFGEEFDEGDRVFGWGLRDRGLGGGVGGI
jgi:hypothetical protein